MLRRHLQVALVTAVACSLVLPAMAEEKKVPQKRALEKLVGKLYEEEGYDTTRREEVFLEIDEVLSKKDGMEALAVPSFWVEAIHTGRFSKRRGETAKRIAENKIEFQLRNNAKGSANVAFHGGTKYSAKKAASPLYLAVLEEGQDAKAYVKNLVETQPLLKENWIVAAVAADAKTFPVLKDPTVVIKPLVQLREWFNVDSNHWFVEGSGATCGPVQTLATSLIPDRVAGIVLRNPTEAITSSNSAMTTAFVLQSDAGAAVGEAWTKLDETHNKAVAAGAEGETAMIEWLTTHPGRKLPKSYSFETTITTDNSSGTDWTGTLRIVSPGKHGEKTIVGVDYDREANKVSVSGENLNEFILYMNDELLDLDKEVTVEVNGEVVAKKVFVRQMRDMFDYADSIGEFGRVFPSSFRGTVPTKIEAAPEEGEKKDGDGGNEGGEGGKEEGGDK